MSTLSNDWDDYVLQLREDAHQLLSWGYSDTRPQLAAAKDEYEITGLLADSMEARINLAATPHRFTHYSVHNEKPISPSGELGLKRPKLDIQIQRNGVRPKPHFTFEAKRLRDDKNCSIKVSLGEYLGPEGIGRFMIDRYSAESAEAAMLGCVQAHDAEFWFDQVGNAFDADRENGGPLYSITVPLEHAHVIADFPDERTSTHMRNSGNAIRVFHLFVDCR